jgi:hypothetical protein
MKGFRTYQDDMGVPTAILQPSSSRHVVALTAGVGQTITVPDEAVSVLFNATGPFWVQYGGAAALPTGSDLSGNAPELAPQARRIEAGIVLGLVAPAACLVSLSFFGGRS